MLERLLHERFADISTVEECQDWAGSTTGLVALFCHSDLKTDKRGTQLTHELIIMDVLSLNIEHFFVSFVLVSMVS